jgi:transposase
MNARTRDAQCTADSTLWLAFELGSTKWTLGFTTGPAQRPRLRTIAAGDLATLEREIATAKQRFGLAPETRTRSCYEAGRDGFWLHRWLDEHGIENVVVDSSSIEVNRKARRTKTDRVDVRKLLHQLLRWAGGERHAWSVVHVPTREAEDQRHLAREIESVWSDRTRVRNRIHGLLATQGARLALTADFEAQLGTAVTGAGGPLPPALRERIRHEWVHLQTIEARATELRAARDAYVAAGATRVGGVAQRLKRVRGIGATSALLFSGELYGTRTFQNGRQVSALTGLTPVPYRSDQRVTDQGISKAGRGAVRRVALQIAWGWLRWQPTSALTQWFHRRFGAAGKRARRIGIVAVARKLLVALWHYIDHGVIPPGAVLD